MPLVAALGQVSRYSYSSRRCKGCRPVVRPLGVPASDIPNWAENPRISSSRISGFLSTCPGWFPDRLESSASLPPKMPTEYHDEKNGRTGKVDYAESD